MDQHNREHQEQELRNQVKEEIHILREILHELKLILKELQNEAVQSVASFRITSTIIGGNKVNINPGQGTVLTAVPLDVNGNPVALAAGDVPNWSASDTSNITATPDPTGLILTVAVNAAAPAGDIVFTIADAVNPAVTGTFTLTVTPAVVTGGVASFSITASTPARRGAVASGLLRR
jgi:hypothetical protein